MSLALVFDPGLTSRWREAVDAHRAHAAEDWPNEACGLVNAEGNYVRCVNRAANPLEDFEMSEKDYLAAGPKGPLAVLHSHTSIPEENGAVRAPLACPTEPDMVSQMETAIPWGITLCSEDSCSDPFWFGDQVPRAPLLGRPFRSGVWDCWSLIRDWYAVVANINLPDFPRSPNWWESGGDMYMRFEEANFARVERGAVGALPGDVFLCSVNAPVRNHGGVYIGDGLLAHHLQGLLSGRAPAAQWRAKMDFLVRHKDLPDDWEPKDQSL